MIAAEMLIPSRSPDAPAVIQTVGRSPAATDFAQVLAQTITVEAPAEPLPPNVPQAVAASLPTVAPEPADTGLASARLVNDGLTDIVLAGFGQENIEQASARPGQGGLAQGGLADVGVAEVTLVDATLADAGPVRVALAEIGPAKGGRADVAEAEVKLTDVGPAQVRVTDATLAPTTLAPATLAPTTLAPTTLAPTTLAPATLAQATLAQATLAPATLAPATLAPTTLAQTRVPDAKGADSRPAGIELGNRAAPRTDEDTDADQAPARHAFVTKPGLPESAAPTAAMVAAPAPAVLAGLHPVASDPAPLPRKQVTSDPVTVQSVAEPEGAAVMVTSDSPNPDKTIQDAPTVIRQPTNQPNVAQLSAAALSSDASAPAKVSTDTKAATASTEKDTDADTSTPEPQAPANQAPAVQGPTAQAPTVQALTVQARANQAPAVQGPTAQAPAADGLAPDTVPPDLISPERAATLPKPVDVASPAISPTGKTLDTPISAAASPDRATPETLPDPDTADTAPKADAGADPTPSIAPGPDRIEGAPTTAAQPLQPTTLPPLVTLIQPLIAPQSGATSAVTETATQTEITGSTPRQRGMAGRLVTGGDATPKQDKDAPDSSDRLAIASPANDGPQDRAPVQNDGRQMDRAPSDTARNDGTADQGAPLTTTAPPLPLDNRATPAAAPPATTPRGPETPPLDTTQSGWEAALTERITTRSTELGQEIEITLTPDNLGTVRIKLDLSDKAATVQIVTDTPQAAQLFQQSEARLSEAFNRAGLSLTSHDASSRDPGSRDPGNGGQRQGQNQGHPRAEAALAGLRGTLSAPVQTGRAANLVNIVA